MLKSNSTFYTSKLINTYTLSSRQILGPTTLAAPLAILKAKCFSGQAFEIPHLYLGGFVALGRKKFFKETTLIDSVISLFHISNHKGLLRKTPRYTCLKIHATFSFFFFFSWGFQRISKQNKGQNLLGNKLNINISGIRNMIFMG